MSEFWGSLTEWQRRRVVEALIFAVCAWYTVLNALPDLPYGPVRIELVTWVIAVGLAAWWLSLTLFLAGRAVVRSRSAGP